MSETVRASRAIFQAETAADDAEALAERMRDIGAWGAFAALSQLAREREARAERLHAQWRDAVTARARVTRLAG